MDTTRLKFPYSLPDTKFFSDLVQRRKMKSPLIQSRSSRFVYTNNELRRERKKRGIYTPKYWIEEHYLYSQRKYFVIEFSAPKLVFGENISELHSSDFPLVINKLQEFLNEIEVSITEEQIRKTTPIAIAFGKNIDITRLCSCNNAIQAISLFDDRFRSKTYKIKHINGGLEFYFGNKNSTLKFYDKLLEISHNPITDKERAISKLISQKSYKQKRVYINELLRIELTLKNKDSVRKRLGKYCNDNVTFENIFSDDLWFSLLQNEIRNELLNLLKDFIFLSQLQQPEIDAFLDKNIKCDRIKNEIRGLLCKIQEKGLAGIKQYYLNNYNSRQTWYNRLKYFQKLSEAVDFSEIKNLTSSQIHTHILEQFKVKTLRQDTLF